MKRRYRKVIRGVPSRTYNSVNCNFGKGSHTVLITLNEWSRSRRKGREKGSKQRHKRLCYKPIYGDMEPPAEGFAQGEWRPSVPFTNILCEPATHPHWSSGISQELRSYATRGRLWVPLSSLSDLSTPSTYASAVYSLSFRL